MDSIEINHGSARVVLDAVASHDFADGDHSVAYMPQHLVDATMTALKAVDNNQSRRLHRAIERGLKEEGVKL